MSMQVHALDMTVQSVNCTALNWVVTLSQSEWTVASYVNLIFTTTTQPARNYSLSYTASRFGDFPQPGTYSMVTPFGNTVLSGSYRMGVALADQQGDLLPATTSFISAAVQVSDLDPRVFTFDACSSSLGAVVASSTVASSSSTSSASVATSTSSRASAATTATSTSQSSSTSTASAVPASSAAPASVAASTSSSAAAAAGTLSSSSTATLPQGNSMNKGAIAGAVIGALLLLAVLFALLRWCQSRRRTRELSRSQHRLSPLRPLALSEKAAGGPTSPTDPHRFSSKFHASGDTLDAATLGRYSVSSVRKSDAFSPRKSDAFSTRAASRMDNYSLNNVYIPSSDQEHETEIQVVKVPFNLFPAPPVRDTSSASPPHSPYSPYLSLHRTTSNPDAIPAYPSGRPSMDTRAAKASALTLPLPLQLPSINTSPLASPTRSMRPSPSTSTFRIPRVTVPTYNDAEDHLQPPGQDSVSRANSLRRLSTSGATFVSIDEDPFVDAAQEQPASPRERTLV
ncbi:hypothetical protein PSEUBRA_000070 [Kalmanozyma brasiliensis GHG001]|uniref:Uncharacterized protein n=1 Tax=Kalmanozyma brasiliensis (strain GHG001) TaxID=1365824 RepID=V5EGM5_KALBG|nr:uncharacterized protein PSEUBRA_000070 [Kalmanozyma brasiliensis GHG001]EST09696.1 hypothetical protein PSEUBRA_000070 [Kalmanozyma brasiliensis GHG001]